MHTETSLAATIRALIDERRMSTRRDSAVPTTAERTVLQCPRRRPRARRRRGAVQYRVVHLELRVAAGPDHLQRTGSASHEPSAGAGVQEGQMWLGYTSNAWDYHTKA